MSLWQLFSCGRNHAQVPFPEELSLRVMMDDQCLCCCILSFHKFGRGSQLTLLLIMSGERTHHIYSEENME